jgi:hypothetical protein
MLWRTPIKIALNGTFPNCLEMLRQVPAHGSDTIQQLSSMSRQIYPRRNKQTPWNQ